MIFFFERSRFYFELLNFDISSDFDFQEHAD